MIALVSGYMDGKVVRKWITETIPISHPLCRSFSNRTSYLAHTQSTKVEKSSKLYLLLHIPPFASLDHWADTIIVSPFQDERVDRFWSGGSI